MQTNNEPRAPYEVAKETPEVIYKNCITRLKNK